jgi:hypothetical protein
MSQLPPADGHGDHLSPAPSDGAQDSSPAGVSGPVDGTPGACQALSNVDRVAHAHARALWSGLLEPGQAGDLTEAELGRGWTVAQCWRGTDPEADRAAEQAEQLLWVRRPDVMQRYDCLTAVGADHIEATLRVAPSLDRPAPSDSSKSTPGGGHSGPNTTTDGGPDSATSAHACRGAGQRPLTVHDLEGSAWPEAVASPVAAPMPVGVSAGPRGR